MPAYIALPLMITTSWLLTSLLAIPFWLVWTVAGVGSHYFDFLPQGLQAPPLLPSLGLFFLLGLLKSAMSKTELTLSASR